MSQRDEPSTTYEHLRAQQEELLRARAEIDARLAEVGQKLKDQQVAAPPSAAPSIPETLPTRGKSRPVRMLVLDALDDLRWVAYSREIAMYVRARYGREIPPTRFSSLTKDEMSTYESRRPRSVYLCHGLLHERGEAIKRLWGRSDWPLAWRVVAPTTGRVQHLKLTIRLCELAPSVEETAADPDMLRFITADHARDVPGIKVKRGEFHFEHWREVALEVLANLEPRDEELREKAAAQFAQLPEAQQLFGVPDGPMFPVPTPGRAASGGRPGR